MWLESALLGRPDSFLGSGEPWGICARETVLESHGGKATPAKSVDNQLQSGNLEAGS